MTYTPTITSVVVPWDAAVWALGALLAGPPGTDDTPAGEHVQADYRACVTGLVLGLVPHHDSQLMALIRALHVQVVTSGELPEVLVATQHALAVRYRYLAGGAA